MPGPRTGQSEAAGTPVGHTPTEEALSAATATSSPHPPSLIPPFFSSATPTPEHPECASSCRQHPHPQSSPPQKPRALPISPSPSKASPTGRPLPARTLEDFSIQTLSNKLEDQSGPAEQAQERCTGLLQGSQPAALGTHSETPPRPQRSATTLLETAQDKKDTHN